MAIIALLEVKLEVTGEVRMKYRSHEVINILRSDHGYNLQDAIKVADIQSRFELNETILFYGGLVKDSLDSAFKKDLLKEVA